MMKNTKWIATKTGHGRIGIEPPCTGSPNCSGAIHIEREEKQGSMSAARLEIHLTADEIKAVRKALKKALEQKILDNAEYAAEDDSTVLRMQFYNGTVLVSDQTQLVKPGNAYSIGLPPLGPFLEDDKISSNAITNVTVRISNAIPRRLQ